MSIPIFTFDLNNPKINNDVLEIIDLYITHTNSSFKASDKPKLRQGITQIFTNFLNLGAQTQQTQQTGGEPAADLPVVPPPQVKYSLDRELVEKISSIEKRLFKQNFSYASCVMEKINSSKDQAANQSGPASSEDGNNGADGAANEGTEETRERVQNQNNGETGNHNSHRDGIQNGFGNDANGNVDDDEGDNDRNQQDTAGQQQAGTTENQGDNNANQQDRESADQRNQDGVDDDPRNGSTFSGMLLDSEASDKDVKKFIMSYLPQSYEVKPPHENEFITFYPRPTPSSKLFFGGSNFYVCLRFYYTTFERVLKAYELAKDIPDNEVTAHLTAEERAQLAEERYETFKEILKLYIREPFESATFEDCLRCIYGRDAGFLFSIDKIVNNIIKNIPGPNDDLSTFVMENSRDIFDLCPQDDNSKVPEIIKYALVSQKLREMQENKGNKTSQASAMNNNSANVLRYFYDPEKRLVHINVAQSLYHKWNQKSIKVTKRHFDLLSMDRRHLERMQQPTLDHTRSAQKPSNHQSSVIVQTHPANRAQAWEAIIYMLRNRKSSQLKSLDPKEVYIRNRVSYKVACRSKSDPA